MTNEDYHAVKMACGVRKNKPIEDSQRLFRPKIFHEIYRAISIILLS